MKAMLAAGFVHPLIAAGAVGLGAVPILIHLLNRRRFREVRWAAMDFLLSANRRSARRVRIEQLLLLATRIVIMVVAAAAVARPFVSAMPLALGGATRTHRILLVDNSGSMEATGPNNQTNFERAKQVAEKLLDSFPNGDGISLITVSRPAKALIERAGFDRSMARKTLAEIDPTHAGTDLLGGLELARHILAGSDAAPGNRAVYLISDNAATAWRHKSRDENSVATLAGEITSDASLFIFHFGLSEPANVAVTSFQPRAKMIRKDLPSRWSVEVGNFGRMETHDLVIEVLQGGRVVHSEPIPVIASGSTGTTEFLLQLPEAGENAIQVRLRGASSDALGVDDVRYFAAHTAEHVPVLLVDGKPGPNPFAGETGYLATAMAPKTDPSEKTWIRPKSITALELDGEALEEYRMVVLCNVRRLEPDRWKRLRDYAENGGALWFFMGDQVNVENYNRYGFAGGKGLLPGLLGSIKGAEAGADTFTRLRMGEPPHPALVDLASQTTSGLFLGRVHHYLSIDPTQAVPPAEVFLSFDTGEPAIVGHRVGSGYAAVCATTANMAWNNLPAKGDFVSLILEMTGYLIPSPANRRNLLVGQPIRAMLTARETALPLRLMEPNGKRITIGVQREGEKFFTRYEGGDRAGMYELYVGEKRYPVAVNFDESESDLRSLSRQELADLLQCDFEYLDRENATAEALDQPNREMSTGLFAFLLMLLLAETLMAMRFGHHH